MIGLDTNVLARYYVSSTDAASQQQGLLAHKLIESGKRLYLSKSVVLELEWVLRGYYKSTVADVLAVLRHLQALPNLEIEDRLGVEQAIDALADGAGLEASSQGADLARGRHKLQLDLQARIETAAAATQGAAECIGSQGLGLAVQRHQVIGRDPPRHGAAEDPLGKDVDAAAATARPTVCHSAAWCSLA